MADLTELSLSNQLSLMRSREISPVDLMKETLSKAEAVNQSTSAFVTIDHDRAMEAARRFEGAYLRAEEPPPLAGIPMSVKDTEPTAGLRTTFGSAIFKDNVPTTDGTATANLKRAGAIIFAKTNTPAFGHKDVTDNLLQPPARNPLRLSDGAGGSSGGAAIAVAAGVSAVAHGTDGAGSLRIPASLCGVLGFKPSYGLIPNWPNADLWAARTHHGVLARRVEDIALSMRALAQADALDPLSTGAAGIDWHAWPEPEELRRKRGFFLPNLGADPTDIAARTACANTVSGLAAQGLPIEEGALDLPPTHDWYSNLWQAPLAALLEDWLRKAPELLEPSLVAAVQAGQKVDVAQYLYAREQRSRFHTDFLRMIEGFDYLLCPTLPCASWPVDEEPLLDGGRQLAHGQSGSRWEQLYIFNILGWPAISIPCGYTPDGRPVGIQIAARKNDDLLCLGLAACIEQVNNFGKGL